jgi:hypothetical protein
MSMGNIGSTWRRSAGGKAYGRCDNQAGGASVKNFSYPKSRIMPSPV